jgi:hypothetical protein
MDDIIAKEPHFSAIVAEVHDSYLLVEVNEGEEARLSSDLISVSLAVENKDGLSSYNVGDEVVVYYDGTIAESYPAQVNKVFAITTKQRAAKAYSLVDPTETQKLGTMLTIMLYADGTAGLALPPISSYMPPDCTYQADGDELLICAAVGSKEDEEAFGIKDGSVLAKFEIIEDGGALKFISAAVPLFIEEDEAYRLAPA